ncbi:D-lactate dehydrogenase [cytochrome] 2 [Gluconacetobacter sp. SXCC-1]|uniref:FAD-binding oxidoreductase n=1 Tax=Komagataeibacter rhaeticus TaxID=215221 RepID=A0A181CCA7_9PROT|nr:FAD-binding oxidoreductase [Komagataeibacter rhaeticus]ATU71981.1 FAD-binding oxidoreductase [Komagataeibacter xylinus]EGG75390.1 D-lactate dehydrogenase [cytochrome] 2 [Gluconacetobacter sp. SXCC-1]QIP35898.1 FAD-binding oxidoreductase [Komagataeibacter rhaeticus]QOC45660.1 FAD-binding oxidoreductase [Komagataeibacter rhaeticus]WPP21676.1 FAD-binding oxidoreductase [Komagataeibacter rhaeticus]
MSQATTTLTPADLISRFTDMLGPVGVLTGESDTAAYCTDWRDLYHGRALAVLRPASTRELAGIVRLCAAHGVPMVPQGGNTSMVGGATPDDSGHEVVVCLSRMNRVRNIDPHDLTMEVEAGVTLKAAQDAAREAGFMLPLSISSEGSAQIGGVLATNAGGNNTLRYGNARELVLGLEAVMPDGAVFHGLRRLRKDNTGYALRQLLIGSEGTLGFITTAILQLHPRPRAIEAVLCAVDDAGAALRLLGLLRGRDPALVQAFEYMSGTGMDLVTSLIPGATLPLGERAPAYVLVELATPRPDADLREYAEEILGEALEDGIITDAVIAESEGQRAALWKLREEHAEAQRQAGASVKNDVSVPVTHVPALIDRATAACAALVPGIRAAPFGHMGDGNIHFNLVQPEGMAPEAFLARSHDIMDTVAAIVKELDGSFSAEHGVGQLKPYMMPQWRGGAELAAMRHIKAALDPHNIMNPGKVLPPATQGA